MIKIKTRLIMGTVLGILGLAWAVLGASPLLAGNGAPTGPDYQLNIIGVEKGKTAKMTDSNRRTIFVALGKNGSVLSNIYLTPGDTFQVCDGNAFDPVYACDGTPLTKPTVDGALFQLPCNTNIPTPAGGTLVPCSDLTKTTAAYTVWARALGSPKGQPSAVIQTCAFDTVTQTEVCSLESVMLVRMKGQSQFQNVTNQLTSILVGTTRTALFQAPFQDFLWQYTNTGLKLAQLRFYLVD